MAARTDPEAPLAGLRVLVSRPQHQAESWSRRLTESGAKAVPVPLLQIVPVRSDTAAGNTLKSRILDLDCYSHAIFVSQNAVRVGLDWIEDYWPQIPLGIKFYAVGAATARLLRNRGLEVEEPGGSMNTEALLELPQLRQLQQQRVLIFRGLGGRPALAESLLQRGARVDYCELYERCLPADAARQLATAGLPAALDVVSVHSGETLQNFRRLVSQMAKDGILDADICLELPVLVPGDRVSDLAAGLGFNCVVTAINATDDAMLEALVAWCNRKYRK